MTLWERGKSLGIHRGISAIGRVARRAADCADLGAAAGVLYWENSIGRSKSCDIYLPDATASRDHAVLLRRDEGWFICDTGSKSGVYVNGRKIDGRKLLNIGDKVTMGSTTLVLRNTDERP